MAPIPPLPPIPPVPPLAPLAPLPPLPPLPPIPPLPPMAPLPARAALPALAAIPAVPAVAPKSPTAPRRAIPSSPPPPPASERWESVEAYGTIGSSEDRSRTLSALVIRNELEESSLLKIIDAASDIPSGSKRAALLIDIAHHSPAIDSISDALIEAVDKLPYESDRNRFLRATGK